MALSENAKMIYGYIKEHDGENFTAQDIADATGLAVKTVNGSLTMSFQRHSEKDEDGEKVIVPLIERVPATIELEDGTSKTVKFIKMTAEGRAFDPDAE